VNATVPDAPDPQPGHTETPVTVPSVPLVISVTGHANLVPAEMPLIRARVRQFLEQMLQLSPHLPLRVMTSLAEGADRLVAEEALALGIPLVAILPMPRALYRDDFDPKSREVFEAMCARAEVIEMPLLPGADAQAVRSVPAHRNRQYAQVGVFLCAHCHVLLALWDGKPSDKLGGTAQTVFFHHHDYMPGYTSERLDYRERLADDDSDLIYHVTVSRNDPQGAPAAPLEPGETGWFTTDAAEPRSEQLPKRYRLIFTRMAEYNADLSRYAHQIAAGRSDLPAPPALSGLLPGIAPLRELFAGTDWLAVHYQRQFHRMLRITHAVAVLMGLAYIGYSDVLAHPVMIGLFLGFFMVGFALFVLAGQRAWHRKYLDYRTLAEGLRVQYFWATAGIRSGTLTKFAYDNFLQKQDAELGWIRNVMRVGGLLSDVQPRTTPAGLTLAIDEWIGEGHSGQLGYYGRKARACTIASSRTEQISLTCMGIGILLAVGLMIYHDELSELTRLPLKVLMAILPLIAATRGSLAQKKAEKELIKQYRFMHRIFSNARRQLSLAGSDEDRRDILKAVGQAALDEHAEWILMHRERPLELGGL
jgi:hypothetical protein